MASHTDTVRTILRTVSNMTPPDDDRPSRPRASLALSGNTGLAGRALSAYTLAESVWSSARAYREAQRKKRVFTVSVRSDDVFYNEVQRWLMAQLQPQNRKALVARSRYYAPRFIDDDEGPTPEPSLILIYNDNVVQDLQVEGHRVRVHIQRGDPKSGVVNARPVDELTFTVRSEDAQAAVVRLLERLVLTRRSDKIPALWVLNSSWNWTCRSDLPARMLDTVVLAPGQADRLVEDIQTFLAAESRYSLLGLPWHRGYLFHGPPGTGKTSVARALATHLGLDLWYAPLREASGDGNLMSLMADVKPRSMLLLEDVDSHPAVRAEEGGSEKGVSPSGFLNALDGVGTPHGLIIVMTTNHPEKLSPAVIRPGRVDRHEEFGPLTPQGVRDLFHVVYDRYPTVPMAPPPVTPAQVMEVFKRNLDDPDTAEKELGDFLGRLEDVWVHG